MVVFGTQMHIVTFVFVIIELVIYFYLVIYKMAMPDDGNASLNIVLISLLLLYNITGGLLPDDNLPGSYFVQESIAYGTGFITPSYFPYYVYRAFSLSRMKFHALKGILLFLVLPYLIFIILFAITNSLQFSQNLLILPVFYAVWVIFSLYRSIRFKYKESNLKKDEKQEFFVLLVSLTPWIGLPVITYFNWGQATEALITNLGFLMLFGFQVNRSVTQIRREHERLIESERELLNWTVNLQNEVEKRTKEIAKLSEQRVNVYVNLVHETKTPLTIIRNCLDEYIARYGSNKELDIIKGGVDKLTTDIINMFDIERFTKGIEVYRNELLSDFSSILKKTLPLFEYYCQKQEIICLMNVEENLYVRADPNAINRIVNNLIENAVKFTEPGGKVEIALFARENKIVFAVADTGIGIHPSLHSKVFEAYYQINHKTTSLQGMGLGLPIVKKAVDGLGGQITIESNLKMARGSKFTVILDRYIMNEFDTINKLASSLSLSVIDGLIDYGVPDAKFFNHKPTLLVVEDNKAMLYFLSTRLRDSYNVFFARNGVTALKILFSMPVKPDIILSDIMMDEMDGVTFLKTLSEQVNFCHIPVIFLTAKSTAADRIRGLKLGAVDYIPKPFSFNELNQKIKAILGILRKQQMALLNASIASFRILEKDMSMEVGSSKLDQSCKFFNLTARETEVVRLMISGKTYKDIGNELFISERTVTKHVQNIFEKAAVSNKIHLFNKLNK